MLFDRKKYKGMTIIELVIATVIIGVLVSTSTFLLRKNTLSTRLYRTTNEVVNLLLAAQNHATTNNVWTQFCIIDDDNGEDAIAAIFAYPGLSDGLTADPDPTLGGTYPAMKIYHFEQGITVCQDGGSRTGFCSEFTKWATENHCIAFKPNGYLRDTGNASEPNLWTSVCIISRDITNESESAHEIEITSGGSIQLVPKGQSGENTTADIDNWSPVMTAGTAPCSNGNL